jgi:hypothetical protein
VTFYDFVSAIILNPESSRVVAVLVQSIGSRVRCAILDRGEESVKVSL